MCSLLVAKWPNRICFMMVQVLFLPLFRVSAKFYKNLWAGFQKINKEIGRGPSLCSGNQRLCIMIRVEWGDEGDYTCWAFEYQCTSAQGTQILAIPGSRMAKTLTHTSVGLIIEYLMHSTCCDLFSLEDDIPTN